MNLPNFEKAEFLPPPVASPAAAGGVVGACGGCARQIAGEYYLVNNRSMCVPCANSAVRTPQPGRNAAFSRAILFGLAAAVVGMLLYATVEILTGWVIGYVAIAVGYMVGMSMKKGSGGRGGRRYQIAAALLTYAAVSMAAIPVGAHAYLTHRQGTKAGATAGTPRTQDGSKNQYGGNPSAPGSGNVGMGGFVLEMVGLGLASPLMNLGEGASGVIGLFILFIGIRAAWKLTAGREVLVTGPHRSVGAEGRTIAAT